jgi:hypothetical protein
MAYAENVVAWFSKNNDPTIKFIMGSSFTTFMNLFQMIQD